jgi:hypothetical protein
MFLGLLDPDSLVRGMDPHPDPVLLQILLSSSKNSKKNLNSYLLFCDFFLTFYL